MGRASAAYRELHSLVEAPHVWKLLSTLRWGVVVLNAVEQEMGWKFAYVRRDRMEKMTKQERYQLELETQRLFIEELEHDHELELE